MPEIVIAGTRVPGGAHRIVRVQVAHDVTGAVEIVTHVVAGRHDGPTLLLRYVSDFTKPSVSAASRSMAVAYGFPVLHALTIHTGLRGPRTSLGFAGERYGVPGIVAEVGGLGFGEAREAQWLEQNVAGTMGVMQQLGMLAGAPPRLDRYLEVHDYWRVGPRAGGYLEPVVGLDRQFTDVQPNELMARVVDPRTFETVDDVRSPGYGTIFYACRAHMVRPGGWAFGVANREDGRTGWVSA